jgi:metacaspase-1
MITPEKAKADCQAALAVLARIAERPEIAEATRRDARQAATALASIDARNIEMEIHALRDQYQGFILSLEGIIERLRHGGVPSGALRQLVEIAGAGTRPLDTAKRMASPRTRVNSKTSVAKPGSLPAEALRILCVHGVGHQEKDPAFEEVWTDAIAAGLRRWSLSRPFAIQFVAYDRLFANASLESIDLNEAVFQLAAGGFGPGLGDGFCRARGFGDLSDKLRWTAGMVAQWAESADLRAAASNAVREHLVSFNADVIMAHSLGSLLCYDLFHGSTGDRLLHNRVWVTLGSQIGNPFVRDVLGGRIETIRSARQWFHLYNIHDEAFAAPLRVRAENFQQVTTPFDLLGWVDHDVIHYLGHPNTLATVWRFISQELTVAGIRSFGASARTVHHQMALARRTRLKSKPQHRALLVGINQYPDPANRLEGCVNDVFLMSSVLQECGFAPEDIRVVLNERATAKGVLERLEWLLDGAEDGQNRVLFYSGHGAQMPGYGAGEKADHVDECLVTYDFDWSREHAVIDDQFYELYSQLPDAANFLAVFDCCHSGGLARDGGLRVRGLNAPDDIRHRALRWNMEAQMWETRLDLDRRDQRSEPGQNELRWRRLGQHWRARQHETGSKAYRPILLQACQEQQFSYEYRHGVTAYGAFTYALAQGFRQGRQELLTGQRQQMLSWRELTATVAQRLASLRYDQKPVLVCPPKWTNQTIPWQPARK